MIKKKKQIKQKKLNEKLCSYPQRPRSCWTICYILSMAYTYMAFLPQLCLYISQMDLENEETF
jgi:hypothetical protein